MAKKPSKSRKLVREAFREVYGNPPSRVKQTRRAKGPKAAHKQEVAIALSKARRAGAKIPKKPKRKKG